jgi:uncharacterized repeat protein (TIGR01451 family)
MRNGNRPARSNRARQGAVFTLAALLSMAGALKGQTTATSAAFGESVSLRLLPLLGQALNINSGPLPAVAGSAAPPYDQSASLPSANVSTSLTGTVFASGQMTVHASSAVSGADTAAADATVNNPSLSLLQLLPLLTLGANAATSTASISGSCAGGLVATGTTSLVNPHLGGSLGGGGLSIPSSPAPNTVLVNAGGIRVVLNEQILASGTGVRDLTVNAIHVSVSGAASALGALSGDVVLAQSHAMLHCDPTRQPAADLAVTVAGAPDPSSPDQVATYTLTVTNHGPDPATGVSLSQVLPDHCDPISASPTQGSCASPLSCALGNLAAGQSVTVSIALRLHEVGTNLFHTATTSNTPDPDPSNNQAARTITVNAPPGGGDGGGSAGPECAVDAMPAATLLYPYFQVDLSRPDGASTLFSIVNAFAAPRLVQVTLWTNWSVPTLIFPVYLTGFDAQTFNLRDILAGGRIPQTGLGLSPDGPFSNGGAGFPGCAAGAVAAALPPAQVAHLAAWHTGARSPMTGSCAATPSPDGFAVGYVTVDVVRSCSPLTPADPGYFGPNGVAADDNVLFGDFTFIDPVARSAKGDLAVHIVAEPGVYSPGDYTFYARYVHGDASDHRRPLGTRYATRFLAGGNFGASTALLVWRDTKEPSTGGMPCGQQPAWMPMTQNGVTVFDEQENASVLPASSGRAPLAVQALPIGKGEMPIPSPFGWMTLDLGHGGADLFGGVAQGWITTLVSADGRFTSIAQRAVRLGTACGHF